MSNELRAASLAGAVVAAASAVAPPLDRLADASFAWHMTQHLVLLFIVPLLVLLAGPFDAFARVAGKQRTAAFVRATRPFHVLASPPVAYCAFVATLWVTHFSGLYELSLEHVWIHVVEHVLYVVAGTLFWLPVLSPPPLRPQSYPARAFYLFLALPQGALLGAALSSTHLPLYAHYAALMSPAAVIADQQNAAAVLWIGGGIIIFSAMLATMALWAAREASTA